MTTEGERLRVEARAASGQTEQKLWVRGFVGDRADMDALEREIATVAAEELVQPFWLEPRRQFCRLKA